MSANLRRIFTIIVTYNGAPWIKACIESLMGSTLHTEIIIVDNGSSDGTLSIIKETCKNAIILPQADNLGFGKANNIGLTYALKQGADTVFLLNQDARVDKNTLEALVAASKAYLEYGVLSPVQCQWDGTQLEYYFSRFMEASLQFYSDFVLNKPTEAIYEVPFVNAAAWLLTRHVLEQVGGFDPIFKHYGEDNNYCQRLQYHGFKVGVVPNAYIYHDSQKRTEPLNYLFSDAYWHQEVKNLQIRYANINIPYTKKDFNTVRVHVLKLVIVNLMTLKFPKVWGYLKKYRIFEVAYGTILSSRIQNMQKGAHYLDL